MVGSASQALLTGVPVSVPDQNTVRLRRTGELRKPAPLLPYQHSTQEDTVELDLLPLTSKKYNITVPIRDSLPPELEDKQVPAASSVPGEQSAPRNVQVCIQQFYDLFLTSTFIRIPQQHLPRLGWQCHLQG